MSFFFLRNRKSQSRYNVVEIEVNFVSTGRDSDKYNTDLAPFWLLHVNISFSNYIPRALGFRVRAAIKANLLFKCPVVNC